jgi:hypothetical protein
MPASTRDIVCYVFSAATLLLALFALLKVLNLSRKVGSGADFAQSEAFSAAVHSILDAYLADPDQLRRALQPSAPVLRDLVRPAERETVQDAGVLLVD